MSHSSDDYTLPPGKWFPPVGLPKQWRAEGGFGGVQTPPPPTEIPKTPQKSPKPNPIVKTLKK